MTRSCLAFTLLLCMIDVRWSIALRRRRRWWRHRTGKWLLPALRGYTEVCTRMHWLPSNQPPDKARADTFVSKLLRTGRKKSEEDLPLLQRNLPLANAATPNTLRMKRNKGDPAELKPRSRLALEYGGCV